MRDSSVMILKILRKSYKVVSLDKSRPYLTEEFADYSGQQASDIVKGMLLGDAPAMIARFGSNELTCIINYCSIQQNSKKYFSYVQGKVEAFWWDKGMMEKMGIGAGFFPTETKALEKFAELMLSDMKELDILGSWLQHESFLKEELAHAVKVRLADLEPYYHQHPWSTALAGKKVLVIHPFEDSIKQQYLKRDLIFSNNVLPDFELRTIKAVQTAANKNDGFKNWFEALNYMKDKISDTDFDVAIIGCGAYGFPLAAHVKRIGKKAVHLGGATQILFGKRWEEQNEVVSSLMNQHWVRPSSSEKNLDFTKIENGCYW